MRLNLSLGTALPAACLCHTAVFIHPRHLYGNIFPQGQSSHRSCKTQNNLQCLLSGLSKKILFQASIKPQPILYLAFRKCLCSVPNSRDNLRCFSVTFFLTVFQTETKTCIRTGCQQPCFRPTLQEKPKLQVALKMCQTQQEASQIEKKRFKICFQNLWAITED